ncbi:hypothetical protein PAPPERLAPAPP_03270 [Brevundimonas phage vB_BpoS-Papperlapapp]|uniref:Uncharacterized protein n=2 Tax=Marchewkavirus TaxID=3425052 RepID=A0A9E7MQ35_9CAUD|nr:hypothetical protein KABACHOK_01630 [Brevundimonas phage vB_BpoS-Kabachok]USN14696.1 hypothetical protein DOMOVOI_02220 [Brevundimonas phage vB_BpoS-Domovoi]USN16068.1 hypothetical protein PAPPERLAPAPP_03270 [Brevundimonas phage vB_BpoS-Papperlapapp]
MYRLIANMRAYLKIEVFADTPEACIARFREVAQREARKRGADWTALIDEIAARCENGPEGYIDDLTGGATFVDYERAD